MIHKKKTVIISVLIACMFLFLGLLFVFKSESKPEHAKAETHTSENLSFTAGAQASLNESDLYQLRFILNVDESAFSDGNVLTIRFFGRSGTDSRMGLSLDDAENRDLLLLPSDIEFTSGQAQIPIYVSAGLNQQVQLKADIGDLSATSDARSIFYIWTRVVEDDFVGLNVSESIKEYIRETVEWNIEYRLDKIPGESELSFFVRLSPSALNLLKQGRTVTNLYSYTDYFLEFVYTDDSGGSASSFRYHIDQSPVLSDTPGAGDSKYDHFLETPYPYDAFFTSEFLSGGSGTFSVPAPYPFSEEYSFTVRVVKATYREVFDQSYAGSDELIDFEEEVLTESESYYGSFYDFATELLETDESLTDEERKWLQDAIGVSPTGEEFQVTVKYKTCVGYADIVDRTYTFNAKSVYAQNQALIVSGLYDISEYTNISDFNVVYTSSFWQDGYVYTMQERIILQAQNFEYTYDAETESGTLEVVYNDFQYKDLSLRITNNDPENHLAIDFYTANVTAGPAVTTLRYNYEDIEEQLYNSCNWLFDFGKENIQITNKSESVTAELTNTELVISFPNARENELMNLSLVAVAEIIEDVEYSLTYEYIALVQSGTEIIEEVRTSAPITKLYSEIVTYNFTNFMTDYGTTVNTAVNPVFLGGAVFYTPESIRKEYSAYDSENHTCKIIVEYSYNTLFCITDNYDDTVTYKALNHSSLTYSGDFFVTDVPSGYRIESISTTPEYSDKLIIRNNEDYTLTQIEVRTGTSEKEVLPIEINFTDNWNLIINYLENYIDYGMKNGATDKNGDPVKPCFAEKKQLNTVVKVSDYADIYNLSAEDLEEIIGHELSVLGLATVENIDVTFDNISTYTVELSYSHASLSQIDYNGNKIELKIPLTSYADWCAEYGQEWSILFLNKTDRQYFKYSNDVARENLYGFFSVAVFKEQVSDLNYWFQNNTGDGCMTIFTSQQVSGSELYKFFYGLTDNIFFNPLLGYVGMALCEVTNDDNAMYYSYFFYLDGTSDDSYLALNGADDADDTDGALDNTLEDLGEWFNDLWEKFKDSEFFRFLKIFLGLLAGVLLLSVILWLISVIVNFFKNIGKKK